MPCPHASIGSTPSCSHPIPEMSQLTELHPGNYIFYGECPQHPAAPPCPSTAPTPRLSADLQQTQLGSCQPQDVAIRVLTRVIGHYEHRGQLLVDCGWTALSLHGAGAGRGPQGCAAIDGHPELR